MQDQIGSAQLPWLVAGDYSEALIHLARRVEGQSRSLIFGMIELYPSELPSPDEMPECGQQFRDNATRRSWRVYVKRHRLSADAALEWYGACRTGTIVLPGDMQRDGSPKMIAGGPFAEEPPWPRMIASNDLPFVSVAWGTVRVHHLLPLEEAPAIAELNRRPDALSWLSSHLLVDLGEYREYLGSLHLVAPNPVLRDILRKRERLNDGNETTVVRVVARAGCCLDGLSLEVTQHGPRGIIDVTSIALTEPVARIPHVGTVETVEHRLICPVRGVLDWSAPVPYIGQINTVLDTSVGSRTVQVPDAPGRPGERYTVPLIDHTTTNVVGAPPDETPMRRVHRAQVTRDLREETSKRSERWFRDDRDNATEFVGSLIGAARSRVWIIDPYFSAVEFYRYGLRVARHDVEVTIVTSAVHMQTTDQALGGEAGLVLFEQQERHRDHGRFTIRVMTGDPPVVHDRFLVIDDTVWLSGNSLHTLGARAGMIVKLADPVPIINELQRIIEGDRVLPLDTWVQNQQQAQPVAEEDHKGPGTGEESDT